MRRQLLAFLASLALVLPAQAQLGGIPIGPAGGSGGGSGTVTSIATGCQATGGTITATGTISTSETVNLQTGSNYAIQNSDCGKLVNLSNAAAQVPTIAQAGTGGNFAAGWFADICNNGAGTQVITPATSTINGNAAFALIQYACIKLISDGTNYKTIGQADLPHPGYIATNWYVATNLTTSGGAAVTANLITCYYGIVPKIATVEALGVRVNTLSAGGNVQLAIYTNLSGSPGTLITKTASISVAGTGGVSAATGANVQIGPGGANGGRDIWFCANNDNSTALFNSLTSGQQSIFSGAYLGANSITNLLTGNGFAPIFLSCSGANCQGGSSTFGTWPASLATSTWTQQSTSTMPTIVYQVLSSP